FSTNRDPVDLLVAIAFGIIGYFMKRTGYPRPALILGLVLGDLLERYLYRSMASYGFTWLLRPAVIVLLILAFASLGYTLWDKWRVSLAKSYSESDARRKAQTFSLRARALFPLFFFVLFLGAIITGWEWPFIAKLMPVYVVAIPGLMLSMVQLLRELTEGEEETSQASDMDEAFNASLDKRTELIRTLTFFGWVVGGAIAIWLLGVVIALPLLALLYTLVEGREKWTTSLAATAGIFALVWGLFDYLLEVRWPSGMLFY
ncbi:MAG: tripartite tricarboxylate transporter TctB family protein, partial [Candidatus Binatia bacterium]